MKLKSLFILFLIVSFVGSIVACSTKDPVVTETPAVNGTAAPASAAPESTPVPKQKFTITYYGGTWWAPVPPSEGPAIDAINAKFNVDFKVQYVPQGEYPQKQSLRVAANDIPDYMDVGGNDTNFRSWAALGAFLPLDDYIDKYESLKAVPSYVWDQLRVNGHIYAIPRYFPAKFGKQPIIRQDWLDNLGLAMPTNYEELKKVAIAFTNDDPDKDGKKDTYGVGLAKGVTYNNAFGAYWGYEWENKTAAGDYIPGDVSPGAKERISFLHDLYTAGAINKDWPTINEDDVQKDFYAGKIGIWFEQMGKPQHYFDSLLQAVPTAKLSPVPPFKAPDGSQGYRGLKGYNGAFALSAKLKDEPGKAERILEMLDFARTYIPDAERTPQNATMDFMLGKENSGYTMVNKVATVPDANWSNGLVPETYLDDPWYPSDYKQPASTSPNALQKSLFDQMLELSTKYEYYIDPVSKITSPLREVGWGPLYDNMNAAHTKFIVGDLPMSDWDKVVKEEFSDKGGQAIVEEVNQLIKDKGVSGEWIK